MFQVFERERGNTHHDPLIIPNTQRESEWLNKQTNKITVLDLGAKPTNHLVSIQDIDNGTIPRITHVTLHVMVLTRRLKQRKYLGNSHSIRTLFLRYADPESEHQFAHFPLVLETHNNRKCKRKRKEKETIGMILMSLEVNSF